MQNSFGHHVLEGRKSKGQIQRFLTQTVGITDLHIRNICVTNNKEILVSYDLFTDVPFLNCIETLTVSRNSMQDTTELIVRFKDVQNIKILDLQSTILILNFRIKPKRLKLEECKFKVGNSSEVFLGPCSFESYVDYANLMDLSLLTSTIFKIDITQQSLILTELWLKNADNVAWMKMPNLLILHIIKNVRFSLNDLPETVFSLTIREQDPLMIVCPPNWESTTITTLHVSGPYLHLLAKCPNLLTAGLVGEWEKDSLFSPCRIVWSMLPNSVENLMIPIADVSFERDGFPHIKKLTFMGNLNHGKAAFMDTINWQLVDRLLKELQPNYLLFNIDFLCDTSVNEKCDKVTLRGWNRLLKIVAKYNSLGRECSVKRLTDTDIPIENPYNNIVFPQNLLPPHN